MKFLKIVCSVMTIGMIMTACQNVDFKKTSAGVPYKVFGSSKTDSLPVGSVVKYAVILKIKDSVLYSSYQLKREEFFEVAPTAAQKPAYFNTKANVEEILRHVKKGDSIYMVQATDSLIKQDPQSTFKKGEQLVVTARVLDIYKNAQEAETAYYKEHLPTQQEIDEANKSMKDNFANFFKDSANKALLEKDNKTIEAYLKSHNINAQKTEMGIYKEEITPGQGPQPKYKQFVTVKYKGTHLSGEVFDEGVYPLQVGVAQVVPGFMFAVTELHKGEKARFFIPSILGYGAQGNPPKINPNEILVFEMELTDISDVPPPQPQQQQQQQPQPPTGH